MNEIQKLIILDRDGVINYDSDDYIKSPEEFHLIPGSIEAIARLKKEGYIVAVATNQSGIARGLYDLETYHRICVKLETYLRESGTSVDYIAHCPHGPDDNCLCRKPLPGMYREISERFQIDLEGVPVIGDSLRDLEAARAVTAIPILVRTGKGERTIAAGRGLQGVPIFDNLQDAVDDLLRDRAQP